MKRISIFLLTLTTITLFAAGLWLWAFLTAVAALYIYTRDYSLILRKLRAMALLWKADAHVVYTRRGEDATVLSFCSEVDVMQMKSMIDGCIEQERAVESVREMIGNYNGE